MGDAAGPSSSAVVAFAGDEGFLLPLAVSVRSLSRVYDGPVAVASADLSPTARSTIEAAGEHLAIEWIDVEPRVLSQLPAGKIDAATYLRIFLPDLLPRADRILYLDSDVLVRRRVDDLLRRDLDGLPIGGVRNLRAPWISSTDGLSGWHELGLDPTLPYFNAGVLLLDAAQWRQEDLAGRVVETALRLDGSGHLRQMDQDALNACFAGRWRELEPEWNQHPLLYEPLGPHHHLMSAQAVERARRDPAVVHFIGRTKPWHASSRHPFTDTWRDLAAELDHGWHPERPSLRSRVQGRLRRAWRALVGS